ncbi:ABC transporter substrate-binding protein [Paenibacillus sp. L3-i20]|uniref:ABC transporter substrate-binding protein n=1 Tax=Paenibacillus sp. L3-i20 TaxID=2905833 RepID=UPI001EDF970C|nr:ABC transporter substrate-binding protein [Paenibacillus sp. L3-i20]GKU77357.1 ABC transporter substrate-binding protein [Paenibacillus sp. L3-i20]
MKQSIVVLMVIVMVIVTACSNSSNGNGGPNTPTEGKENTSAGTDGSGTTQAKDGKDGKKNNTEKKTIVISTFGREGFLLAAKKKYEAKYPHITIDVDYVEFTDANGEAMLEKYRKTTGTAMLSGKGPDLLEMDSLPTESYVNKKLLANLGDMMDKDDTFHKDDYFTNIFEGIKVNGGIYGMPMKVFLYGLIGNETIIENSNVKVDDKNWNWSHFANVTKEISKTVEGEISGLSVGGIAGIRTSDFKNSKLVSEFVNDQYATFVDQESGKANFESAAFIGLLKEVKRLVDEKVIDSEANKTIFSDTHIMSPPDYVIALKQSQFKEDKYKHKSKFYLRPNGSGKEAGGQFRTFQTIGINAKSTVKEEAWHFLKFLMSEELTNEANSWGFPINKKSYALAAEQALKDGKVESPQPFGPLKGVIYDITQEDIDELEKMLNNAKHPVQFKESKINEIITEESDAYFTGQKSPEEVAELIQNRVTTVLNE